MIVTRKLAAILVADIVGFSRLAGADEDRILARLRALRSAQGAAKRPHRPEHRAAPWAHRQAHWRRA
jgi:class 3 adenylate cyclase